MRAVKEVSINVSVFAGLVAVFVWPLILGANNHTHSGPQDFIQLGVLLRRIIAGVVVVLIAIASLIFFWGMARFVGALRSGDEKGVSAGKQMMVWGSIGLFVILFPYALVALLGNVFWGGDTGWLPMPKLPIGSSTGAEG